MGDSGARKPPPGRGNLPEGRANQSQRLPSHIARPTLRPPPPPRVVSGGASQPVANASTNFSTPSRSFSGAASKKLRFYGVVAAGSFAGIVIAGLLVVIKIDKDRLTLLETERSRGKVASAASEQTLPAPSSDAPPSSGSPIANASTVEPVNSASSDAISATSEAPKLPESAIPAPKATALVVEQRSALKETIAAAKKESPPEATEAPTALAAWQLPESPANTASVKTSWFAVAGANASSQEMSEPVCSADRSLHTALIWSKSPDEASALARREGKLVFLIHVSGNFEDPGFT